MLVYLILLFTVGPLIELALLIKVSQYVGAMNTITIVLLTGVIGAIMARSQGFSVLMQIQKDLAEGIMPTERLFDGLLILIGGIVLITPGLITDAAGFFLLIPQGRTLVKLWLRRKIRKTFQEGQVINFAHHYKRF